MAALLKRIQRDRNEQLKHRQKDSQKLIQRNRNILVDLLNKQIHKLILKLFSIIKMILLRARV